MNDVPNDLDESSVVTSTGDWKPSWLVGRLLALFLLAAYVTGLCWVATGPLDWSSASQTSFWDLQDSGVLLDWIGRLGLAAFLALAQFSLVAFLTRLALGRRQSWLARAGVAIAALTIGIALSALVVFRRHGEAPQIATMLWPLVGCLLGTWFAMAWLRGFWATLLLVPKLLLLLLVLGGGGFLFTWFSLEDTALAFEPAQVTSQEKRRLVHHIRRGRTRPGPNRGLRKFQLTEHDLDVLATWGLSLGTAERKINVGVGPGELSVDLSIALRLGGFHRYANVQVGGQLEVEAKQVHADVDHCKLGRIQWPRWLIEAIFPPIIRSILSDPDIAQAVESLVSVKLDPGHVQIVYGKGQFNARVLPTLISRLGTNPDVTEATKAHVSHLVGMARHLPLGSARFGAFVQTAFDFARSRTQEGTAVRENRAAVFALAILLGHAHVETLLGPITDHKLRRQARRNIRWVTLRGRSDWAKHFWVSAALALLSTEAASDAVGLLKEELDAGQGGSGFSFSDLMADRAGTLFALAAIKDEQAARRMQQRLAEQFELDDLFPPASNLPEGLTDAQLGSTYGGVHGDGYRQLTQQIESRLAACDLLQ